MKIFTYIISTCFALLCCYLIVSHTQEVLNVLGDKSTLYRQMTSLSDAEIIVEMIVLILVYSVFLVLLYRNLVKEKITSLWFINLSTLLFTLGSMYFEKQFYNQF